MTTYKHTLLDVIACSWWPNDGPVLLRPPPTPFHYDDTVDVKQFKGRATTIEKRPPSKTEFGERLLAVLRRHDVPVTSADLAMSLVRMQEQIAGKLRELEAEGVVERVVRRGMVTHWRAKPATVITLGRGRAA